MERVAAMSSSTGKNWLDSDGYFIFGKYKGISIEDVVREDPGYIKWIVNDAEDISDEDREIMSQHLKYRGRT